MSVELTGLSGVKLSESNAAMYIIGVGIDHGYLFGLTEDGDDPGFGRSSQSPLTPSTSPTAGLREHE